MTTGGDNPVARLYDDPRADADVPWGFEQTFQVTVPGTSVKETQLVDAKNRRNVPLWRVAAIPRESTQAWELRLIYGTSSSLQLGGLAAPLVAYVPGNLQLYGIPIAPFVPQARVALHVSLKPVAGYNRQHVRNIIDNSAGIAALRFPPSAVTFTALAASTVNMGGVAVPVAAGDSLPLLVPATLAIGGVGLLEHEL